MPPAKKRSPPSREPATAPPGRIGGRWILYLATAGAFAAAVYGVWIHVRSRVLLSDDYVLTYEKVEITPRKEWITTDIRPQVFRDASLEGQLSVADDDLVERVRAAFAMHPWVAKVERVQKSYGRVKVDVVYRQPVCMVEIANDVIPVDAEGVVLPREDFSAVEVSRYPRLAGIETAPLGPPGTRWGDNRVLGGAEIAAALATNWEKLGLARIVAATPRALGSHETPTFDLTTRRGSRFSWGCGPVVEAPGEIPIEKKVAKLESYLAEHGSLDPLPGGAGVELTRPGTSEGAGAPGPLIPLPQRTTP